MTKKTQPWVRAYDPTRPNLSEFERRVLGCLSVPTNPEYVKYRCNGFVNVTAGQVDELLRGKLTDEGWVVNLGDQDPVATVNAAQKHPDAFTLPDEQAHIWSTRMQVRPDQAWRQHGDLWMFTEEGVAELYAPTVDSPSQPPDKVQAIVDAEWARTVHDLEWDKDGHLLTDIAGKLTEPVYAKWFKDVADECERAWGVRPVAPVAGGASGYSDSYEVLLIDAENQKTGLGAVVDPFYVALCIRQITDADTGTSLDAGGAIPTYTGYARINAPAASFPAASSPGGSAANTTAIVFAACTVGTSTVLGAANCGAVSGNTAQGMRKWGDVTSTVISTTQTPPTLAIGAYVTSTT